MSQRPLLASDLAEISDRLLPLAERLQGARILVAGGGGFIGTWLVESLLHLDQRAGLGASLVILTLDSESYAARAPHLAKDPRVLVHAGVLDGVDRLEGITGVTHVIHAASDVNRPMTPEEALAALRTLDQGTEGLLQAARMWPLQRFLYLSSAAVYDRLPPGHSFMEDGPGCPPTPGAGSVYATGKRMAELRTSLHASCSGYAAVIARLGAFIGPLLPSDGVFAAGNFMGDALAGRRIRILGDGTAVRSYQYAADLAVWLWTLLLCGEPGEAYNVGGEIPVRLGELAEVINRVVGGPGVDVLGAPDPARPVDAYLPPVNKAMDRFGLVNQVGLEAAIQRTLQWSSGHPEPT